MKEFKMPSFETAKSEYAGQDPVYENRRIMRTTAGEKVIIVDYRKEDGLYVVMNVDDAEAVSPAYKIHPDKLLSTEEGGAEKEQTPEEIRSILEKALEKGTHIDLVIMNKSGEPVFTPDLIVEEMEGDNLMMTYIAEDGDAGELIPLGLARIKKAELRKE